MTLDLHDWNPFFRSLCSLSEDSWKPLPLYKDKYDNFWEQTDAILGQVCTQPGNWKQRWQTPNYFPSTLLSSWAIVMLHRPVFCLCAYDRDNIEKWNASQIYSSTLQTAYVLGFLPVYSAEKSFKPKMVLFPSSCNWGFWGLVYNHNHQIGHFASDSFAYMTNYGSFISVTLKKCITNYNPEMYFMLWLKLFYANKYVESLIIFNSDFLRVSKIIRLDQLLKGFSQIY